MYITPTHVVQLTFVKVDLADLDYHRHWHSPKHSQGKTTNYLSCNLKTVEWAPNLDELIHEYFLMFCKLICMSLVCKLLVDRIILILDNIIFIGFGPLLVEWSVLCRGGVTQSIRLCLVCPVRSFVLCLWLVSLCDDIVCKCVKVLKGVWGVNVFCWVVCVCGLSWWDVEFFCMSVFILWWVYFDG